MWKGLDPVEVFGEWPGSAICLQRKWVHAGHAYAIWAGVRRFDYDITQCDDTRDTTIRYGREDAHMVTTIQDGYTWDLRWDTKTTGRQYDGTMITVSPQRRAHGELQHYRRNIIGQLYGSLEAEIHRWIDTLQRFLCGGLLGIIHQTRFMDSYACRRLSKQESSSCLQTQCVWYTDTLSRMYSQVPIGSMC